MYLKTLSIHGFKSFAQKTLIEFDRGVTGIVGPNGCGKSNVVDAIRWVLGETSAKALRGGEMADVIFSGTEKRKALGMAEVTLTLAECQQVLKLPFDEVAITRRVFRDGRSEYRINQTLCRLKDINDLFMDTGIGRTTYSIMAQGQIDQILSSKPEERRLVFEEAAGITKFKREKKDALRKLELTEGNLLRVTDILEEQEKRLSSLRRQATKARQYQTIAQIFRSLDLHVSHREYSALQLQQHALESSQHQHTNDLREQEISLHLLEENHLQARATVQSLQAEIQEQQRTLQNHRHAEEQARAKIQFAEEKSLELLNRIQQNESDIATTKERLSQHQDQLSSAHTALQALSARIIEQETQLAQQEAFFHEAKQRQVSQNNELSRVQQALQLTQNSLISQQARLEFSHTQQQTLVARRTQLEQEILTCQQQHREKSHAQTQLADDLTSLSEQLEQQRDALDQHQASIAERNEQLKDSRKIRENLHKSHAQKQSRLEITQQFLSSGEGLSAGTREVLRGFHDPSRYLDGVRDLLSSHIRMAPEHRLAIETALANQLDALVVTHSDLAENLLNLLQTKDIGNAQIFALDLVPAQDPQPQTLPSTALAWAIDLIEVSPVCKKLLAYLLRDTLLVADLAHAKTIRATHPQCQFITADGFLLRADGLLSGGSFSAEAPSLLTRQLEVEQLQHEINKLNDKLTSTQQAHASHEQYLADAHAALEESRERSQVLHQQISALQAEHKHQSREISNLTQSEAALQSELRQLIQNQSLNQQSEIALVEDLEKKQIQIFTYQAEVFDWQERLKQTQQQDHQLIDLVQELRTQLAVERRAQQTALDQQAPMEARLLEFHELMLRRTQEITQLQEKHQQAQQEISRDSEQCLVSQSLAEEAIYEIQSRQESLPRHEEALAEMEQEVKIQSLALQRLREKLAQIELSRTKLELQLDHLIQATDERHQLALSDFSPDFPALLSHLHSLQPDIPSLPSYPSEISPEQFDWARAKKSLQSLKHQLDAIGPVNVDAIAEFDELQEQHQFIVDQHLDLTKSKADLRSILEKLNTETKRMFVEAFAHIRENFRTMFRQLFGELAKADLLLIDETNPLESGIDIIAKPPGKKLQSISLLSGGERSMTAVALLFSIYRLKPSPFCVLDELDAPLDEANIDRFVKVLDHFIENSQFIIVTHSKRTMNRADVLYGVTMEELGVSKLVSMKMTDYQQASPSSARVTSAQKAAARITTHESEDSSSLK